LDIDDTRLLSIEVKAELAQVTKAILLKIGVLDPAREPAYDAGDILFPVLGPIDAVEAALAGIEHEVMEGGCSPSRKKSKGTLADLLKPVMPAEVLKFVPRSFNIIGDIAVMELDERIELYKDQICEKLRYLHPSLKAIYIKQSERAGEFRTSQLDLAWGIDDPVTEHRENGCRFFVNVKESFFDPRLLEEHGRIVAIAKERTLQGSTNVLDLFCGVGPFVIPIARLGNTTSWAVDLNSNAIDLLETNIKANHVPDGSIKPICADSRDVLADLGKYSVPEQGFDMILLNLPRLAHEFIQPCLPFLAAGGTIHWYTIAIELDARKTVEDADPAALLDTIEGWGDDATGNPISGICPVGLRTIMELGLGIKRITRVKSFAPYRYIYCFDLYALSEKE
jgi:tRNA (guanine37-N1)-methyltransferase